MLKYLNKKLIFAKLILNKFGGWVNICITGLNYEKVVDFAYELATKINYKFFNAKELFSPILIKSSIYPTAEVDDLLNDNETKLLKVLKKTKNSITSIPSDMFLSNKHSALFKNSLIILVLEEDIDGVLINLQQLLNKQCKFCVKTKEELINLVNNNI